MIAFHCGCGQKFRVDVKHAGRTVKCGRCGAHIVVPQASERETPVGQAEGTSAPVAEPFGQPRAEAAEQPPEMVEGTGGRPQVEHPPADAGERDCGPYKILRPFAKGGMGQVSIARDQPLKREVAVKELLDAAVQNPASRHRFIEEAEITGQLEHPGVVPVYALGMDREGRPYYAMRLVHGKTLKQAIDEYHRARTPARLRELLRRFIPVCQTMAYAHARGVIHRDLKPSNILLGGFGETLVLDWGLAKPVAEGESAESTLGDLAAQHLAERPEVTDPGRIMGTLPYMSPEQASGRPVQLSPATDVYSLGAVLYQVLTGKPAYSGESSKEVLEKVRAAPPPRPSSVLPGVPRPLEAICLRAMDREPGGRYATAVALAEDVQNWLDDERVTAYSERPVEQAMRWARRHKTLVAGGIAALVCAILAISVIAVMIARERAKTEAAELLAEDYARQAEDALEQARQKEEEARRLAEEAEKARAEAGKATQQAAQATQAANEAKTRIGQLEADLKVKTDQTVKLKEEMDKDRAQLAAAETRAAAETERARAANEKVKALEEQAAALRREARDLRSLAAQLAQLALRAKGIVEPPAAQAAFATDFTEAGPEMFDATAADKALCTVTGDTSRVESGRQSLRLESQSGSEVCITYPRTRSAGWDLSKQRYLSVEFFVEDPSAVFQKGFPRIRIGCGSRYVQYEAQSQVLDKAKNAWAHFYIPLAGDATWTRTDVNALDLAHVDWIEIHVAGAKPGLKLWLDDLRFGPGPNPPPLAVAPFDGAQAHEHQDAWARYLGVPVELTNSIGMKLVLIPAGEYTMGITQAEAAEVTGETESGALSQTEAAAFVPRWTSGATPHGIRLSSAFYLGKYEVTVAQFRNFAEGTGYKTHLESTGQGGWGYDASLGSWHQTPGLTWRLPGIPQADDHPVVFVTWDDATSFCQWLERTERVRYRLPTEAEWEYACRAGTTTRWHCGDDVAALQQNANLADQSLRRKGARFTQFLPWDDGYAFTSPAGRFQPNPLGLHDMAGNVHEWCADWYDAGYYAQSPPIDPSGPASGGDRVARGGAWTDQAGVCRSGIRITDIPQWGVANSGFRVVREIPVAPRKTS